MDATLELVSSVGLLKTTISKISQQAECSPGIVYHHFQSKDEIVNLLFESIFEEMMDYTVDPSDDDPSSLERFKRFWIRTYDYHLTHPMNTVFLEQFKNSSYYTEEMEAVTAKHLQVFMEMGKADMEAGNMAMLPFEVIQAMTWDVAKSLAKVHAKAGFRLDDETLDMVAERSCSSVMN
ncbi:MAG: TetR/AcrR family transcriptional regulator [Woeseiaceae bacterium]|nr:TetR/AcrR family transcriptional regulator [Woeseiaceae bacterium]